MRYFQIEVQIAVDDFGDEKNEFFDICTPIITLLEECPDMDIKVLKYVKETRLQLIEVPRD